MKITNEKYKDCLYIYAENFGKDAQLYIRYSSCMSDGLCESLSLDEANQLLIKLTHAIQDLERRMKLEDE